MAEFIRAGEDCFIDGLEIKDANGVQLDVTGFVVEAVARAYYADGEILSRWSTTPMLGVGLAIAGGEVIDRVRLVVTPDQSSSWDAMFVVVQAEMVSLTGQTTRSINKTFQVDHEAVV